MQFSQKYGHFAEFRLAKSFNFHNFPAEATKWLDNPQIVLDEENNVMIVSSVVFECSLILLFAVFI